MSVFDRVRRIGLTLPGIESSTTYDGSPRLTLGGCFVAGLATHESADADTLVVRMPLEQRILLIEDAPGIYYLTDYYQRHPLVLARLAEIPDDALRDLLAISRRMTVPKTRLRKSKNPRTLNRVE